MSWEIIWGSIIGAILSIAITAFLEKLRRPTFSMRIMKGPLADYSKENPPKPAKIAQFLYVSLKNNDLDGLGKWLSTRDTAFGCHGVISFHRMDGTNIFGREIVMRWTNLPEPFIDYIRDGDKLIPLVDIRKVEHDSKIDIHPGEEEFFNVAVRLDDEEECYGWSNRSYLQPLWRDPNWKIPKGVYLVKVKIISSGNTHEGLFRLINDVPIQDFRLDPALPGDKVIQ